MRRAASLSWTGDYRCADRGATPASATYKIWLRKPNSTRLEAGRAGSNQLSGILVGDGANLWIYWPQEKPRQPWESSGKYAEDYEKYRRKFYLKEPAPLGEYSLADHTGLLGVGMTTLTVDPSLFHGNPDSWLTSVDGARALGTEEVGGELCDQIEVSFLKGERTVFYWLAQKDHLPRKIKMVWPRYNTTVEESWSDVTLNAPAPPGRFAWSPPADWKEWRAPALEEGLLKPGTTAPDFELTAIDGSKIKLSALRGQVVWLLKWEYG